MFFSGTATPTTGTWMTFIRPVGAVLAAGAVAARAAVVAAAISGAGAA